MSNRWSDPTPWWSGSSRATAALSPVIGPLSAARIQQPWRARQIDGSGALALSLATAAVGAPNARYGAGWPVRAASPESVYGVLEGRLDCPHRRVGISTPSDVVECADDAGEVRPQEEPSPLNRDSR